MTTPTTPAPMSAEIDHDEAIEIARRLIHSHFGTEPRARASIPARPDYGDDIRIIAYISQQRAITARIAELERRQSEIIEWRDIAEARAGKAEAELAAALKQKDTAP